ncbi:MAG: NAD(P)/FAD-dependent oxidoreductase, partial [Syntrophales bacterium]|nr:NAD(P)/FAD-dependent oxidoreductase [Syntrophales bacterium]
NCLPPSGGEMQTEDVIIIGAGPAGIATAIQLKRYGIVPLLLEKNTTGGLLRNADLIENYPGFPGGISGPALVNLFEKQLAENSINVTFTETTALDSKDNLFRVATSREVYYSRIIVVASGTKPRKAMIPETAEELKDRIFYEVYPLLQIKGKKIVIVGAGDAAFDYALNLGKNNEVIIYNRSGTTKCLPLLRERVESAPSISYCEDTKILGITSISPTDMLVECSNPGGISKVAAHYLVFAVGREPQLDFFSERLKGNVREMEERGILYFAGDVKNGAFRQTAIAVGDGIMAAMKIRERLKAER